MKQYNVEIFRRDFSLRSHTVVGDVRYSVDYLSPVLNSITVFNCEAEKGDYIRISNRNEEFFGIVRLVTSQDRKTINISYASFLSVFETSVLFNTDLQGTSTLETVLKNLITAMYINNPDSAQNITGLTIQTTSATVNWGFNLKSDTEGKHHCIIDFYNVIITRALEKYSVVIGVHPDVQAKTITLTIGKIQGEKIIEADLRNIISKNIVIKDTDKDINKLVVYDTADYSTKRIYYLHSDYSYSMVDTDRVTPVVQEIHGLTAEEGETARSFAQVADSDAANVFSSIEYNNLIELVMANDDALVKPYEMEIGEILHVISKGTIYTSVLTGKTIAEQTQLTCGTIRLDLTKILKRRYG